MKTAIIVAMDKYNLIGNNNQLPWNLPADLAYFKKITMGSPVIMGRKTYESIGKPLPFRENIVITRDSNYEAPGCTVLNSNDLFQLQIRSDVGFVIGGSEIFKMFLPEVTRMYITHIEHEFDGDTYFPQINSDEWGVSSSVKGIKDEKNPYDYYFDIYERKRS